jgi:hypothetical protein
MKERKNSEVLQGRVEMRLVTMVEEENLKCQHHIVVIHA